MSARWRLVALLIVGTAPFRAVGAQELRGVVRDSATQQPIPGAVLELQDASGRALGRGITNDRGQFRVSLLPAARQLRVVRIGFRPRIVPVPAAGASALDVAMMPLPSLLEPIQVSDVTRCSRRPDRAAALALWEQVRTGLLATVVAREANPADMRRLLFDRLLDRSGNVRSQSVHIDSARTDRAFGAALSVAEFLRNGFKSDSGGLDVFYGPDADILLSDEFAAGYCFRIADRDASRPGQIGLGFAPAERKRDRTDIEGTLWVDSIGRRIVDIDYAYLGLDARVTALHPGGRTSFRTMANGMVVLDRWSIRLVGAGADSTTSIRNRADRAQPGAATARSWRRDRARRVARRNAVDGAARDASWSSDSRRRSGVRRGDASVGDGLRGNHGFRRRVRDARAAPRPVRSENGERAARARRVADADRRTIRGSARLDGGCRGRDSVVGRLYLEQMPERTKPPARGTFDGANAHRPAAPA